MDSHKLTVTDFAAKYFPYGLFLVIAIISLNHCFFLDMIQLSSLHATWYYDTNFSHFLLPNEIDSGHPPLNGMMLALLWKIFGRSLWVGHAFIAIWTFILIYQLQKLCENLFSCKTALYVSLVVLMDATLLAQSSLVSPDIILMASFFAAIRAIFENKKLLLLFAILFLSLISMRGMMCTAALFFFCIYYQYKIHTKFTFKEILKIVYPFLPGVLLAFSFLGYHYYKLGWIGYHADMTWAESFQKIESFREFIKNVAIMIWRLIDFGRLIVWLLFIYSVYYLYKNRKANKFTFTPKQLSFILLFIFLLLISSYSFLFHKMLSGHRYLLPHYTSAVIVTFILLDKFFSFKKLKIIAIVSSLVLLSGNFIKYPEKISTGWDSTLSHLPFYDLRKQLFAYMEENNIPANDITAGFGLYGNQNTIDLMSPQEMVIKNYDYFEESGYFIYSNISNPDDTLIDKLKTGDGYILLKKFEKGTVFISLYKKR
ncbi:MAG: glycosyltransferase family 39 protein [Candidatus Symbiothrix sp.]|jgi:hypothetical protein|nr:glycosyltransferase family 39 protein [Candidatus Symbiothrix sp.]